MKIKAAMFAAFAELGVEKISAMPEIKSPTGRIS